MDKLILNVADVRDMDDFLRNLRRFLEQQHVTANGAFRIDEDPIIGAAILVIQIQNNVPVLSPWQIWQIVRMEDGERGNQP